ncbi:MULTISPECIES: YveK family protein [unclassified Lysinibacillus]|uniref:YveK family protein n=1 Tax=unclassified Lysinibacillus TaxID=2636778 RepID=UPI0035E2DAB8
MNEVITLQNSWKIIKKRGLLIILLAIFGAGIAATVSSFMITPIYEAKTQILINQKESKAQQVATDLQLINTYNVIITSPAILTKVIDRQSLSTTPEQLMKRIIVSSERNSQVVTIQVLDKDAKKAVDIANEVANVFNEQVPVLMQVDNVNILSTAKLPEHPKPVKPKKLFIIVVAAGISLLIGFALSFLLDLLDSTVKTEEDIESILNVPIIGIVSSFSLNREGDLSFRNRKIRRGH